MQSNYPPGVTGHEPEIVGYPEPEIDDPARFVDDLLAASEREAILKSFAGTRLEGAHVQDVLSIMYDADYWIDVLDPIAERHAAEWSPVHAYAGFLVGLLLGRDAITWQTIVGFLERAVARTDPHEADGFGCDDCATCGLPCDADIHDPSPEDFGPTVWFRYLGASLGQTAIASCGVCGALVCVGDDDFDRHALNAHGAPAWEVRR